MGIDKDKLLAPRYDTAHGQAEDDVEIPDVMTVRVRGLNRGEVISMRKAADLDPDSLDGKRALVLERKMLALAMIDPELTEAEVRQWQDNSPAGELEPVVLKVQELSGMAADAGKEAYKSAGTEPGPGVRTLPRDEAGDDGGRAAGADG